MKNNIMYIFVFSMMIFFSGCKFDEIKSVTTTGELTIVVDENVEPLMKAEIAEFERLNPEAKVKIKVAPTKVAKADLINGETKFIVVTRNFDDEEKAVLEKNKTEVKEYPIAVDGIGFIVNPKNPVKKVTSDDLKNIFTGKFTKWTEIKSDQDKSQDEEAGKFFKGSIDKIKLFIQRKNSSTYDYVLDSILKKTEYSNTAVVCSTSAQVLYNVRNIENAIGIINMNWLTTGNADTIDSTVKTLKVSRIGDNGRQYDFAEFHQGLIYNASYPYRRTIYVFSTEQDMKLSSGFITFLLHNEGQKVVLKNSLVPVSQPVRTIQIN
ncbi:MAG: substrate-binding domain-containing protein [Ignavibacteria bacterium]|nr:substrate-binding domain-containing protein [Ignavibacteria bacterium]MBK9406128.1 substrate-binding domain-containing protein [Ignavibacteria bacterium]